MLFKWYHLITVNRKMSSSPTDAVFVSHMLDYHVVSHALWASQSCERSTCPTFHWQLWLFLVLLWTNGTWKLQLLHVLLASMCQLEGAAIACCTDCHMASMWPIFSLGEKWQLSQPRESLPPTCTRCLRIFGFTNCTGTACWPGDIPRLAHSSSVPT